jgi:hypothetical protein
MNPLTALLEGATSIVGAPLKLANRLIAGPDDGVMSPADFDAEEAYYASNPSAVMRNIGQPIERLGENLSPLMSAVGPIVQFGGAVGNAIDKVYPDNVGHNFKGLQVADRLRGPTRDLLGSLGRGFFKMTNSYPQGVSTGAPTGRGGYDVAVSPPATGQEFATPAATPVTLDEFLEDKTKHYLVEDGKEVSHDAFRESQGLPPLNPITGDQDDSSDFDEDWTPDSATAEANPIWDGNPDTHDAFRESQGLPPLVKHEAFRDWANADAGHPKNRKAREQLQELMKIPSVVDFLNNMPNLQYVGGFPDGPTIEGRITWGPSEGQRWDQRMDPIGFVNMLQKKLDNGELAVEFMPKDPVAIDPLPLATTEGDIDSTKRNPMFPSPQQNMDELRASGRSHTQSIQALDVADQKLNEGDLEGATKVLIENGMEYIPATVEQIYALGPVEDNFPTVGSGESPIGLGADTGGRQAYDSYAQPDIDQAGLRASMDPEPRQTTSPDPNYVPQVINDRDIDSVTEPQNSPETDALIQDILQNPHSIPLSQYEEEWNRESAPQVQLQPQEPQEPSWGDIVREVDEAILGGVDPRQIIEQISLYSEDPVLQEFLVNHIMNSATGEGVSGQLIEADTTNPIVSASALSGPIQADTRDWDPEALVQGIEQELLNGSNPDEIRSEIVRSVPDPQLQQYLLGVIDDILRLQQAGIEDIPNFRDKMSGGVDWQGNPIAPTRADSIDAVQLF